MAGLTSQAASAATIDGSPLDVTVSADGNVQGTLEDGTNVFFGSEGNAGFFLSFPSAVGTGIAAGDLAGPGITSEELSYTPISQSAVTGAGTGGDPFTLVTVYTVDDPSGPTPELRITHTVSYVNGDRTFRVSYGVTNITDSGPAIQFRASWAADLTIGGSDTGYGFFSAGPPRFVGGITAPGSSPGGIVEETAWTAYQEDFYSNIFAAVAADTPFSSTVVGDLVDNGVGVQWDTHYGSGLADGSTATFSMAINAGPLPASTPPPVEPPPPPPDSDGDGVPDASDACPTVAASTSNGCPPSAKAAVKAFGSAIRKSLGSLSIAALLQKKALSVRFKAPSSGKLTVKGTAKVTVKATPKGGGVPKQKTKTVTLLKGSKTFSGADSSKVRLLLTKKGKALLAKASTASVTVRNVFLNAAQRASRGKVTVKLKRKGKGKKKGKPRG